MVPDMKVNSFKMIFMAMGLTSGQTKEFILANGKKIKCTEKDRLFGKMAENTQE